MVSTIVAESLDAGYDRPAAFAQWLSFVAHSYQFGDGVDALGWLLDLAGAADRDCDDPTVLIQPAANRSVYIASAFGEDEDGGEDD